MLDLFHNPNAVIAVSVFVAGFLGSPHCLAMCGPIAFNFSRSRRWILAYQFGRMCAYTTAGAMLGHFGHAVLGEQQPVWLSAISMGLIGLVLIINGYRAIVGRPIHLPMPKQANAAMSLLWKYVGGKQVPKTIGAFLAGTLTSLLPCGHLYSFYVGAVATGTAMQGAVFMFAFWLGSTPLLSFGSIGFKRFFSSRAPNQQRLAAGLLVAAGLFSVLTFATRTAEIYQSQRDANASTSEHIPPRCH